MTSQRYRGQLDRVNRRDQVERLLELSHYLGESDRLLVEHVYRHGRPLTELAKMVNQRPRALQIRLSKLLKRMCSKEFLYLVMCHRHLDPTLRSVATRVVAQGMTVRGAARNLHLSVHQTRRYLGKFRYLIHRKFDESQNIPGATLRRDFIEERFKSF